MCERVFARVCQSGFIRTISGGGGGGGGGGWMEIPIDVCLPEFDYLL